MRYLGANSLQKEDRHFFSALGAIPFAVVQCAQQCWVVYLSTGDYALYRKTPRGNKYLVRHLDLLSPYWRKRASRGITSIMTRSPVPLIVGDK